MKNISEKSDSAKKKSPRERKEKPETTGEKNRSRMTAPDLSGEAIALKEPIAEEKKSPAKQWGETMLLQADGGAEEKTKRAVLIEKDGTGKLYLPPQGAIIGAWKEGVDIWIDSRVVSRMHARICPGEEGFRLRDLNSRNGTWVNETAVSGNRETVLKDGDELCFADCKYIFRMEEDAM